MNSPPLIYIAGSMRNREGIRSLALTLQEIGGYRTFTDWILPGEETDVKWQEFSQSMGVSYLEALQSPHATDVFEFDQAWLDKADALVLALPAGKSAHIELGYMRGRGKPTFVLMEDEPDRWDIMYRFATAVTTSQDSLLQWLKCYFPEEGNDVRPAATEEPVCAEPTTVQLPAHYHRQDRPTRGEADPAAWQEREQDPRGCLPWFAGAPGTFPKL